MNCHWATDNQQDTEERKGGHLHIHKARLGGVVWRTAPPESQKVEGFFLHSSLDCGNLTITVT